MSSVALSIYEYIRFRFLSIGYKKRIAIQLGILFALVLLCFLPFFTVNFNKIVGMDSIDSEDNTLWQEWIKSKLKKRAFRPIGDIWNKCDDKPDRKLIGKVIVEATRRGVHATIVGNYTIEELLKKGKLEVVVKYRDMTMFNKKLDLCKALVDLEVYCPLKKGETINFWHSVPFPKFIPKGQYTAVSTLYDVHGTCIGQAIAGFKL